MEEELGAPPAAVAAIVALGVSAVKMIESMLVERGNPCVAPIRLQRECLSELGEMHHIILFDLKDSAEASTQVDWVWNQRIPQDFTLGAFYTIKWLEEFN